MSRCVLAYGRHDKVVACMSYRKASRVFTRGLRQRRFVKVLCADGRVLWLNPLQLVCIGAVPNSGREPTARETAKLLDRLPRVLARSVNESRRRRSNGEPASRPVNADALSVEESSATSGVCHRSPLPNRVRVRANSCRELCAYLYRRVRQHVASQAVAPGAFAASLERCAHVFRESSCAGALPDRQV